MSVVSTYTKNLFLVVTCGEDYVFETLDIMKEKTPIPFKLQIWYALKGKLDVEIYNRLLTYTDDVIVANAAHPFAACQGWAALYNDYDYLWIFSSDAQPQEGYVEKVEQAFRLIPHTVCVGNPKFPFQPEMAITNTGSIPDILQVYSKAGVNLLGTINPSFKTNGHELCELMHRIKSNRFNFVSLKGLVKEVGPSSPENGYHNDYKNEDLEKNLKIVEAAVGMNNNGQPYNWWSNTVVEEYEAAKK